MSMFENNFRCSYVIGNGENGRCSPRHFPAPHHWLYGLLGVVQRMIGGDAFLFLGFAAGLGMLFYLVAVRSFLIESVPRVANFAFLLYCLGGGLGGALYLVSGLLGFHDAPGFDDRFFRFARYELMEGPYLYPALHASRLYYTLGLGLGFTALTWVMRSVRMGRPMLLYAAVPLLAFSTLLNVRLGVQFLAILALYLYCQIRCPLRRRLLYMAVFAVPIMSVTGGVWCMFRLNPIFLTNVTGHLRRSIWFSSFLSMTCFHLAVVPREVWRRIKTVPHLGSVCAHGVIGYLLAFTLLYLLFQLYYGALLNPADFSSAVVISDWALPGLVIGGLVGWWRGKRPAGPTDDNDAAGWMSLWLLVFLATGISAFRHGWFLRFMPERVLVLMGVPVAVLAACGLEHLRASRPRLALSVGAAILTAGACSTVVAVLCFQGPWGHWPDRGTFAWKHGEFMSLADAAVLAEMDEGVVLAPMSAPPFFGDVAPIHADVSSVLGIASLDFSDRRVPELTNAVRTFFSPKTADDDRKRIAADYCVTYVYCPDTSPVDEAVVEQLYAASWLRKVRAQDRAVLFEVTVNGLSGPHNPPKPATKLSSPR